MKRENEKEEEYCTSHNAWLQNSNIYKYKYIFVCTEYTVRNKEE